MNFELGEELIAFQDMALKFAQREVLPRIKEEGFKRDLVAKMGKVGLFGCAFPPRFGGADSGFLAHSVESHEWKGP